MTALIAAARKGPVSFEHVAQVARDARARTELFDSAKDLTHLMHSGCDWESLTED